MSINRGVKKVHFLEILTRKKIFFNKIESEKELNKMTIGFKDRLKEWCEKSSIEEDNLLPDFQKQKQYFSQEATSQKAGKFSQEKSKHMAYINMKLSLGKFSTEKSATESQKQRHAMKSLGMFSQLQHICLSKTVHQGSHFSSFAMIHALQQSQNPNNTQEDEILDTSLDDLHGLSADSNNTDVKKTIQKYSTYLEASVRCIQKVKNNPKAAAILNRIHDVIRKAWAIPTHGYSIGNSLCNAFRNCGGLDLLILNCTESDTDLSFSSAKLLEQCLTSENRSHVVESGLDKVVNVACGCIKTNNVDHSRVGAGILQHLFKHSEETCTEVIRIGGLDAILFECRKSDTKTLRHCASALANLSLYGGTENQKVMIKRKVPMWLFPLAFHNDDNIKYYACLAITVLVANAEIEAEVIQSGTLGLVEPFVTSHNPSEFAKSNLAHVHGKTGKWLKHLVPLLGSKREEVKNLAAFHFCMEAGIKKQQGNTNIFSEIGAVEALKKVANGANTVASKYATQALRLIGEEVPYKLSQQVLLWSPEDVEEWIKQIGFPEIVPSFVESKVDGDLLLQLTEENLKDDIRLTNGIKRKRLFRELQKLKRMSNYSLTDTTNVNDFLQSTQNDKEYHSSDLFVNTAEKPLDAFISYRISNGSQLASLLKVHLQLRGFRVFIDVETLEAGKFHNLLHGIQKAKNFLLVLTPNALDRCKDDFERKDWVHWEIVAALAANCNIIPIIDNFTFPDMEQFPEDMRQVCHFNRVRWIHDYQDACMDRLERFMIRTPTESDAPPTQ